ncbi:MAG TPA: hypothetical protein VGM83_19950 [Devosiaceae bacterium]|jgi:hypothetical protein
MRLALLVAGTIALFGAAPAFASSIGASEVGNIFCQARVSGDMTKIDTLISPALKEAIATAEAKNAAAEKQYPGDKPPLGDGIPWASSPDQPPQCTVMGASGTADHPEVVLYYQFPDSAANRSDRLYLSFINDELRIDDVIYSDDSRLTGSLTSVFEDAPAP